MLQSFVLAAAVRTAYVRRHAVRESIGERKQSAVLHLSDDVKVQLRRLDSRMSTKTSLLSFDLMSLLQANDFIFFPFEIKQNAFFHFFKTRT